MILILLGPPGAGKGTQAALVAKELDIPHLSTGDILRNKLLDQDDLSTELKDIMNSGNLVSDNILNKIVANRIKLQDCEKGFVLDGYPRTLSQNNFLINFLESINLSITSVVDLVLDNEHIMKRIQLRLQKENRDDDQGNIIKTRIDEYNKETKPLSYYFQKNFTSYYHKVDGNQDIEKIQHDILKLVKK